MTCHKNKQTSFPRSREKGRKCIELFTTCQSYRGTNVKILVDKIMVEQTFNCSKINTFKYYSFNENIDKKTILKVKDYLEKSNFYKSEQKYYFIYIFIVFNYDSCLL